MPSSVGCFLCFCLLYLPRHEIFTAGEETTAALAVHLRANPSYRGAETGFKDPE